MADKSTTKIERTTEEKDRGEDSSRAPRAPQTPANPQTGTDTAKRGPGSGTNPSGLGGNEESVSG